MVSSDWTMYIATGALFLTTVYIVKRISEKSSKPKGAHGLKQVPWVSGCLPVLGHSLALRDMSGFLQKCFEKYGSIFKIKMFGVSLVVAADRSYAMEFFKAKEDELSFYGMLDRIYLGKAFKTPALRLDNMMKIFRKSNVLKIDSILPKMYNEALNLMTDLKKRANQPNIDIMFEVMKYASNSSSHSFIGIPLTDEMFQDLYTFSNLLNKIFVASYLLPAWFIKCFLQPKLDKLNRRISQGYFAEIEKYRNDKSLKTSTFLRLSVDAKHEITGKPLTNEEIGNSIVCLLYVSTENTSLGIINGLLELAKHPHHWNLAKTESEKLVQKSDLRGIIDSKYLHACVIEAARLNSHSMAVQRKPEKKVTLGDYYIGDADAVVMGGILLHTHGTAESVFSSPFDYNPTRFVREEGKEPAGSMSVITWGAGLHACPGKVFAQYEIKMAIAVFLLHFKFDMKETVVGEKNYFSPSAFCESKLQAKILSI